MIGAFVVILDANSWFLQKHGKSFFVLYFIYQVEFDPGFQFEDGEISIPQVFVDDPAVDTNLTAAYGRDLDELINKYRQENADTFADNLDDEVEIEQNVEGPKCKITGWFAFTLLTSSRFVARQK